MIPCITCELVRLAHKYGINMGTRAAIHAMARKPQNWGEFKRFLQEEQNDGLGQASAKNCVSDK